ncbi:MotA/TolQ/ExbB proton channel family protein [Haloferula rosea]|uniref:MotA/TolQ/ExbB proton channel family protein n=1 Tax=Haloferula rosea TaxID=490093 RepID=A0A934RCL7_9BACT|nr:MotA/TolQ/ExbB proton channel family protein [Haloferula rosea]MBK1828682.1 MotA/TolQ/ExbB proton channel family protein [Haloferula rosea]
MKFSTLIPAAVLLTALPAIAQEEAATDQPGGFTELDFMQIIDQGGIMMYPLALLSVVAMVLILLYLMTIRRNTVVSDRFMNTAEAMIRKRDFLGLIGYCHRQNQCMARITQKSLEFMTKNSSSTFGEIREIAESEGSRQAGMLSSRITYLSDIGSIAPMIGLLGTVLGMIKSFLEISTYAGVKQMGLASGVSEALVTTATGLAIGIPSLVFYSIFRGRVQKYVSELEAATTHLMAMLHAQVQRQAPAQSPPAQQPRRADEYAMPVPSPLSDDRPDLHGI